jgi:hypothetical protein
MADRPFRLGPVALTATLTTNILNPAAAGSGTGYTPTASRIKLQHLRVVNKTSGAVTVSLWIGGTGGNVAGTEFAWQATSVPANSFLDWYGDVELDAADYLVGGASAGTSLTLQGEGYLMLA